MEKNSYISPEVMVITLRPIHMLADSFNKGEGDFDPGSMTFSREENTPEENTDNIVNNRSIWDNVW